MTNQVLNISSAPETPEIHATFSPVYVARRCMHSKQYVLPPSCTRLVRLGFLNSSSDAQPAPAARACIAASFLWAMLYSTISSLFFQFCFFFFPFFFTRFPSLLKSPQGLRHTKKKRIRKKCDQQDVRIYMPTICMQTTEKKTRPLLQ